jgi:hypothetical protein
MMTPNEQLVVTVAKIRKRIARGKFLHENFIILHIDDVDLLTDAAEEFIKELILPTPEAIDGAA